ncbi:MAG TPA: DEAD/DEAH box helicase [Lacipirellulaceae bacterium]|nr:DEAD/DEAH box helicase [Lacipirellulaceae bacterium]
MTKPHSRFRTDLSCSLLTNDLALAKRPAIETWTISEPALDQLRCRDQWHVELPRERLELHLAPSGIVSTTLVPPRIDTIGCLFAPSTEQGDETTKTDYLSSGNLPPRSLLHAPRFTCIRPPRDVVKLEDRLHLLLQPPLEALLAAQELRFPSRPFGFQLDGVAFLYPRHRAVLADEMGLGKTMQTITAMRLLVHQGQMRRVLLICPKPLVTNWLREFARWAPEIPVMPIEGGPNRRQWLWQTSTAVVRIVNYETAVRDRELVCNPEDDYDLVVLDESQRIKNAANATNELVRSIPRRRSWALTGTPIENSVDDLRGIFEFVSPGLVQPKMKPRAAGRAVADYVLRRTKDKVLSDLPPKLFRDAEIDLSPEQAESYRLAEDEGVVHLRQMKGALTIHHVFELVLRLKQICNFDPATGVSSKFERLEADLDECAASGRKAIVFSQWVQTLAELGRRLGRFAPLEYHGQVPSRQRDAVVARFREDPDCHVILMSYGAGGVGLNLQFASYVFLFDRWWNPAVEDQAINRAHRIGVQRAVTVTRFLVRDTIEQRINEILERKRALFDTVFNDAHATPTSRLSREEIFSLFSLEAA